MACTDDSIPSQRHRLPQRRLLPACHRSHGGHIVDTLWTRCGHTAGQPASIFRSGYKYCYVAYRRMDREGGAGSLSFYGWREKGSELCELMEKPEGNLPLEDLGTDGTIIFKWILMWDSVVCICLRTGTSGGCCEYGKEHSASIKCGELVD